MAGKQGRKTSVETIDDPAKYLPRLFENRLTISVDELAEALGVTPRTVELMAHRRQIPCVKVGRRRMFIPQQIVAWLQTRGTTNAP